MNSRNAGSKTLSVLIGWAIVFTSLLTPAFANTEASPSVKLSETGEYIVKLRENAARMSVKKKAQENGAAFLREKKDYMLIKVSKVTEKRALSLLASDPGIAYVEPNIRLTKYSTVSDPGFPDQWGLDAADVPEAWEKVTGTSEVTVAVVDTGVDYTHPDLAGRVDTEHDFDYVNFDDDAMDDQGHGTHVAGIIAAKADEQGVVGVAGKTNVRILPLKVLDQQGVGDMFDVAMAIMDAADLGASVINLSLGGEGTSQYLTDAVSYAMEKGALVVAAAGNDAKNADTYIPASIPGVVTVSAVNDSLTLTDFSNYGSSVDLAAPGQEILSTWPGGQYAEADGTSQAAPFVSGVAALLKVQESDLTVAEMTQRLTSSATDLGVAGRDTLYGRGLVNAAKTLEKPIVAKVLDKLTSSVKQLSLKPGAASPQIALTAYYKDKTTEVVTSRAEWTSLNTEVATVANGLVTAETFGKTTIVATFGGKSVKIPVEVKLVRLDASVKTLAMKPDDTANILLTATYGDQSKTEIPADEVVWKSQNNDIATVENGLVTAKNFGKTTISATYGGKSVNIPISITLVRLEPSAKKIALKPDGNATITLKAIYGDKSEIVIPSNEVVWASQNEQIATVADGVITAKNFGNTTISATYRGKTVKIPVEIKLTRLVATPSTFSMKPGASRPVQLTAVYGTVNDDVTDSAEWMSSNEQVAVYEDGSIVANGFGKATITAAYKGKTVKVSVDTTLKKWQSNTTKQTIKVSESFTPILTATYNDKSTEVVTEGIEWASSNQAVASVDENGSITAISAGKATISAKYGGKTIKISITVIP